MKMKVRLKPHRALLAVMAFATAGAAVLGTTVLAVGPIASAQSKPVVHTLTANPNPVKPTGGVITISSTFTPPVPLNPYNPQQFCHLALVSHPVFTVTFLDQPNKETCLTHHTGYIKFGHNPTPVQHCAAIEITVDHLGQIGTKLVYVCMEGSPPPPSTTTTTAVVHPTTTIPGPCQEFCPAPPTTAPPTTVPPGTTTTTHPVTSTSTTVAPTTSTTEASTSSSVASTSTSVASTTTSTTSASTSTTEASSTTSSSSTTSTTVKPTTTTTMPVTSSSMVTTTTTKPTTTTTHPTTTTTTRPTTTTTKPYPTTTTTTRPTTTTTKPCYKWC